MRWQRILSSILLLALAIVARAQQWQEDSIAYQPKGNYYLIYQRDATGAWRLRRLLTSEEYFSERALRLNGARFYALNAPKDSIPKKRPKFDLKANGHIRLNLNNTSIKDENPVIPIGMRQRSFVDFTQEANVHLQGSYGDHIQLDVSYNTETALANQRRRLRLQYEGDRHDFVQRLQAGNVRMESRNPLIDTGQELFGVRGDFLLGSFTLQSVASRQHSEERRIVIQGGRRMRQIERKASDYDFAQHFFLSEFFAQKYDQALQHLPIIESDLYIDRLEVWVSTAPNSAYISNLEPISAYTSASLSASSPPSNELIDAENPLRVSSAQRLPENAYTYHPNLGYISLNAPLADGQVLAVVYSYTYEGRRYQVGEFQSEGTARKTALLCGQDKSPSSPLWPLMMKNGYSLQSGSRQLTEDDLHVELLFKDLSAGIEKNIVDRGEYSGQSWLYIFRWDQTNRRGNSSEPDGIFDLFEGVTYSSQSSTLFLPYRRPFETVPAKVNGSATYYPIYSKLYDATQREALQSAELDRFVIRCQVSGASTQMISLDSRELLPGSVRVERGGHTLNEGVDYTINYSTGYLTLTSDSNERIEIIIQEHERSRRKEKSLVGAELNWSPFAGLNIGTTWLSYWENSRRNRVRWGEEALKSMMWGLHASYVGTSMAPTRWLNDWSGLDLKEPSAIELQASYAFLRSSYNLPHRDHQIIIEDFEQGNQWMDLTHPKLWQLGALPSPNLRAQMAWFTIDPLLVADGAKYQPDHLRADHEQRKHPLVRQVSANEFFPKRDDNPLYHENLMILNLSYYPEERGPFNLDASLLTPQGTTKNPSLLWGSIMTSLPIQDLEKGRYSYLEAWILDPFSIGMEGEGDLLIDLGKIKEEILPDGGLSYEGAQTKLETPWGKRADQLPQSYGFDVTGNVPMELQDIGLDGMSSEYEKKHSKYAEYLEQLRNITTPHSWENQPFGNPQNDPAGDDYHFFLGDEWDQIKAPILQRYKYINGTEGNSLDHFIQGVQSATTWLPDTEDLNRDMIQSLDEAFFRYHIPITSYGLSQNNPQVVAEKVLPNGERWVKLRIALNEPTHIEGSNPSLQDVRTMRLSLTNFPQTTHLRITQFRLISTAWSAYDAAVDFDDRRNAELQVNSLSLEEDSERKPVPYVSPPGVFREEVAQSVALTREDEQALALDFSNLEPDQAVAVFQEQSLDLRHYERLGLFVHLHSPMLISKGDLELFIRLGQDYTENYYEYTIPLTPTPFQDYEGMGERELQQIVWLSDNQLSIHLSELPQLKKLRAKAGSDPSVPFRAKPMDGSSGSMLIKGHPTLGDISALLIGVRNRSRNVVRGEVWLNELSVTGARGMGGQAIQGSLKANLAELASLEIDAQKRSAGFGGVADDARKRELADLGTFGLRARLEAGLLFPTKWQLHAPIIYSLNIRSSQPLYDPQNSDLKYDFAKNKRAGRWERVENFEINDLFADPKREKKRFYHINNLHFKYQLFHRTSYSPELETEKNRHVRSELSYTFEPNRPNYYRLHSRWNRLFHYQKYAGGDEQTVLSTLLTRWDWERAINIRQELLPGLQVSLQSSTMALIDEPFTREHLYDKSAEFRWLTQGILRDIFSLGTTMHYANSIELGYRLPVFQKRGWQGLQGSATWRSNYQWDRGSQSEGRTLGHRAENSTYFDLLSQYDFSHLYSKQSPQIIRSIGLHFRQTTSSAMPGFLAEAGKAFGFSVYQKEISPSFFYFLGLDNHEHELRRVFEKGWISTDQSQVRPLSFYKRDEFDATFAFSPLKGLDINLHWLAFHHKHNELQPLDNSLSKTISGSRRMSIFAKKSGGKIDADALQESFFQHYVVGGRFRNGLPSFLSTLPNIELSYQLQYLSQWLKEHFTNLQLRHRYAAFAEIPNYYLREGELLPDISTLSITEELNPLIGINIGTKLGINFEERYIQRRSYTLLSSSQRILEQSDHELSSAINYAFKIKPLFRSKLKLLHSFEQQFSLQFHHRYTRSLLQTELISDGSRSATQGVQSHTLQCSVEYGLSEAISLRAFYELQNRRPLVSNYSHPYRRTSYGVLLNIQLR